MAIVTGASRGIGRAVANSLAAEGASVVLAARDRGRLETVAREIVDASGRTDSALSVPTDLTSEAEIDRLVKRARERFGRLDILVNNAGVAVKAPLENTKTEDWDRLMAVNARAPFLLCRAAVPLLRESGGGVIVNIASVVGVKGYVQQAAYTASKHALMGMTKVLAQEVKADGIRVHAVCPGGVATDMVKRTRPDLDDSVLMSPDEIAEIVLFLIAGRGNAVIDEIHVRRSASEPWFS